MQTPSPKFFCPRCRAAYEQDTNYCGKCGADMHRSSALMYRRDLAGEGVPEALEDRREPDDYAGDDSWVGRTVDARYRVLERIGHGGMGVVYRIVHERMGKIAAMKVLHRELAAEREIVRRFRREAQAVSRLNHPNTVQVFDFGTTQGALYLVMEYVRGQDLGAIVKRDGPMPFTRAAPLLHQICAALAEAHALGIVHRDLKPENIIVTRTRDGGDFVKVLDFGLAKLSEREELNEVTGSGSIVGTPYYMAPEQIRGEEIDTRADIYSLGALMYRVVTGEPPYRASSPVGVLTKHLTAELVPPSARVAGLDIDPRVDQIVLRAMQKQREHRYQSVDDMREALDAAFATITGDALSGRIHGIPRPAGSHAEGSPRAFRARTLAAEVDWGIAPDQRLEREDIDRFERRMRRRRAFGAMLIPLAIAGVGAFGAWWTFLREPAAVTAEREPNDQASSANIIESGARVTGYLGRRISETEPDRDVYRLRDVPAPDGSQTLTVQLTPLPNIDVTLQLYDAAGRFIARADAGGVGEPEYIHNYRVNAPIIVVVTESEKRGARLPTENVSDAYTLAATLATITPTSEVEPNEMDSNAVALFPDVAITGYLAQRGDVDAYRFQGSDGTYRVTVTGANDVPISVRKNGETSRPGRSHELALARGDVLRVERTGDPAGPADEPYLVAVSP